MIQIPWFAMLSSPLPQKYAMPFGPAPLIITSLYLLLPHPLLSPSCLIMTNMPWSYKTGTFNNIITLATMIHQITNLTFLDGKCVLWWPNTQKYIHTQYSSIAVHYPPPPPPANTHAVHIIRKLFLQFLVGSASEDHWMWFIKHVLMGISTQAHCKGMLIVLLSAGRWCTLWSCWSCKLMRMLACRGCKQGLSSVVHLSVIDTRLCLVWQSSISTGEWAETATPQPSHNDAPHFTFSSSCSKAEHQNPLVYIKLFASEDLEPIQVPTGLH